VRVDAVNLARFLVWLHDSAFASAVRDSDFLFPSIECVHVLAITLVVGSIAIVDLRLVGLASTQRSVAAVTADVLPFTWTAFGFAVLTGAALFASHAVGYAANFEFRMKILLLIVAGINMLTFHGIVRRNRPLWLQAHMTPWPGRVAGLVSLLLWIGIVAFGRWIGFEHVR
jgi:predicted membrane protein